MKPQKESELAPANELSLSEMFAMVWDAGFSACYSWQEKRRKAPANELTPAPANPLKDKKAPVDYDDLALSSFALVVSDKLAKKRERYPDRDWTTADPKTLSKLLREHVEKGDPVDVAAFCMFLHQRGLKIE